MKSLSTRLSTGMLLMGVLVTSSLWARPVAVEQLRERLELEIEVTEKNIRNVETARYFPLKVIAEENGESKIVPRENPFIKRFEPGHPLANQYGMVHMPNIEVAQEKAKLELLRRQLALWQQRKAP